MHSKNLSRREFLAGMSAAALSTIPLSEPYAAEPIEHPRPTADTCILLWMAGGMAAPETFDPKRYLPFEIGLRSERILCTFPSIDTAVDESSKHTHGRFSVDKPAIGNQRRSRA